MKFIINTRIALLALLAFLLIGCGGASSTKTLLITGQNNHDWKVSHLVLEKILENSGMFDVDLAVSPAAGSDMSSFVLDFSGYDLVVLDYNGDDWPQETNKRFEEYVKNGGGVVVYHAADNSFPSWKAYNEMIALGGWEGRDENSGPWVYWKDGKLIKDNSPGVGGSHGKEHEYVMNIRNSEHPVIKGLPAKWKHTQDELYDRMRGPGDITSLLYTAFSDTLTDGSGREEPLIFTVDYGKGRVFHTMLGHSGLGDNSGKSLDNNISMQCAGFQATLLRGGEWAATGKVTQEVPADFPTENKTSLRPEYKEMKK